MKQPRERLGLRDDDGVLSPPVVVEPLFACSSIVVIRGFVAEADLEITAGPWVVPAPGGFPEPDGCVVTLPGSLQVGHRVRARQRLAGVDSDWSAEVEVRSHRDDYPAGPPRPEVNPAPVYECGRRTGVGNLLIGSTLWITANGVERGRVNGANQQQGVNVEPAYGFEEHVFAHASLCDDPAPPSAEHVTQIGPYPLAALAAPLIYENGQQLVIDGVVNGGTVAVSRNGGSIGESRCWGGRLLWGIAPPAAAPDTWSVTQKLCPWQPESPPATSTTKPCHELPAPTLAPISAGATLVTLVDFVPDARTKVFASGQKVGDATGGVIWLTRALQFGEQVAAYHVLGGCISQFADVVMVQCFAPTTRPSAAALNLFPVGRVGYDIGDVDVRGRPATVRGTIYYPGEADGENVEFNRRLSDLGRVPLVVMVHGNHDASDPSYLGYPYFQEQLARMGMVAVSVDENDFNYQGRYGSAGGANNIEDRAVLLIASIRFLRGELGGGPPRVDGHIDFDRTGLMGHSRGGEAVIRVAELPLPAVVRIRSVLSLAPVDHHATTGAMGNFAFLTILPAGDGDVRNNEGARHYDQATPGPYRSQVYVDHACHNLFNREWTISDAGSIPVSSRGEHERILSAYGCALFRHTLLGHPTRGFLDESQLPATVNTANVHISFTAQGSTIVDDHQQGGLDITTNTLGAPTSQHSGLQADEYPFDRGAAGAYNGTFFGLTVGMVADTHENGGAFRSALRVPMDLTDREIRIRAGEVSTGAAPGGLATAFEVGLETIRGNQLWVHSDAVGGVPRPYDRTPFGDPTKTMPSTLRFPARCFNGGGRLPQITAIWLRLPSAEAPALAFDDLEIV